MQLSAGVELQINQSFRHYIEKVASDGLLRTVDGSSWDLEIGAITDANSKANKYTLLFDNVKGYPKGFRVLTGSLLDATRVAHALGLEGRFDNMKLTAFIKDRLKNAVSNQLKFEPVFVSSADFMTNVQKGDNVDLTKFPVPKWFKEDGGRYIGTMDAVITRDPDTGWVNVGTYRIMMKGKDRLVILMEASRHGRTHVQKYLKRGQKCPIAISVGHNPALNLFSANEVPEGVSEYNFLGAVRDEPMEVYKGNVTGLPLPADSEIVIEGYIDGEMDDEGPLGEFMGYYAGGKMRNPVIKVEAVYYRNDPILLGTCAGKPPYDYSYFRCPIRASLIWNALESSGISGINGVWCHEEGYSRAFTTVSVKQTFGGQAVMAGHIASQCRPGAVAGRYTVVVDEDIDPSNLSEVVWAMCSRNDPATGIDIIRNTMGTPLDPISRHEDDKDLLEYTSSRAVIYAVKPFDKILKNTFPEVVKADPETDSSVRKKYEEIFRK